MGAPTPPPPLGQGPKAGFPHPRFKTVGALEPSGNYTSQISTQAPIDPARQRDVADVKNPFRSYGTSSGDRSRAAFSQSLADTSRNALRRATDEFNTQYRQQAEKSRAEDVLAQRQNTFDRYRMDVFREIFDEDTRTHYQTETENLKADYEREKKNAQAQVAAAFLGMLGGLI
jgi:hypothetical protein